MMTQFEAALAEDIRDIKTKVIAVAEDTAVIKSRCEPCQECLRQHGDHLHSLDTRLSLVEESNSTASKALWWVFGTVSGIAVSAVGAVVTYLLGK